MNYKKDNNGFVALFTVLLTSVILAMAVGIASISLKEIVLSSSASDGSKAFYAADSGIECLLYYERTDTPLQAPWLDELVTCNSNPANGTAPTADSEALEVYNFEIPFGENDELCADVLVKRQFQTGVLYNVLIESKGSNVPCSEDNNPKKVERTIRVTY